jgi:uncharacterized protein DUF1298
MIRRELLPGLHSTPFDAHIGRHRAVAFATTPLSSLHDAAHSLAGATVNDAVLAVIAGALRRWLQQRHGVLRDVRVKVPVSLHHETQPQGNNDSYFCLPLPVGEPDPRKRLQSIRAATALRKTHHDAQDLDELLQRLSHAAPGLQRWAQRLQTSPRTFALNVSNVPGPPRPVSVLGAPVRSMHPWPNSPHATPCGSPSSPSPTPSATACSPTPTSSPTWTSSPSPSKGKPPPSSTATADQADARRPHVHARATA